MSKSVWGTVGRITAVGIVGILGTTVAAVPAAAVGETLQVTLSQLTGTPRFDDQEGPGRDISEADEVIRTNDLVTYNVEIRVEGAAAADTTFEIELPLGYELNEVPAICAGGGSTLTPTELGTLTSPLTSTSYEGFERQTLVCNVGERTPGSTFTYPLTARVRSEVPNGTVSGPVTASVRSAGVTAPVVSNAVQSMVSAAAQWDLSKNGTAVQPDSGYVTGSTRACAFDATQACMTRMVSVLIGAPNGGKGTSPISGPITFTDDLTPASLYPAGVTQSAAWTAAGADALTRYGARLVGCYDENLYASPLPGIGQPGWGGIGTEVNAVRKSGSITCEQPGGPGTPVAATITGTDSTLLTRPSQNGDPAGSAIPSNYSYIVSQRIEFEIPVAAVRDLGVNDGGTQSLQIVNRFKDLSLSGLDGTPNQEDADDPDNNYRTINLDVRKPGGFSKQFVGEPGAPGNTPPNAFNPGYGWVDGPPGQHKMLSGQITVAPGQIVLSGLIVKGSSAAAGLDGSALVCDAWDPTKLTLAPNNYPATSNLGQNRSSGGAAVWFSGALQAPSNPAHRIQYSTGVGGAGTASSCEAGEWFDSPADVPGGTSAVSRVRIWVELEHGLQYDINETYFMIALRVAEQATTGEILPNWAGVMFHFGEQQPLEQMLTDDGNAWITSTYDPSNHSGSLGDRLIAAPAFSRLQKMVKGPRDADFSDVVPVTTGGDQVQYRLAPSLTSSAASTTVTQRVTVEDCLPVGQVFVESSITPAVMASGAQTGAELQCAPRETYVRWDLGQRTPNDSIDPILLTVRVSPVASSGTYTNRATVAATNDPSTFEQRSDSAQIRIVQPAGVKIDKVALTPVVEINRVGETSPQPLRWRVDVANVQAPGLLSDVDVIDVLPRAGVGGTAFSGELTFGSAKLAQEGPARILYTATANPQQDPSDASNQQPGSTVWCDAPASGTPVVGAGSTSDCPEAAAQVTAIRVQQPGSFSAGDIVSFELSMVPTGNANGDVYVNSAFARVAGLALPVGPVSAPERVVSSTIGDRVWEDINRDGIQNEDEPGIAGWPVTLVGTDTDGNAVRTQTSTSEDGTYRFEGLASGRYRVIFDPDHQTSNERFTKPLVGSDAAIDSDANAVTGATAEFELGVGAIDLSWDAGIVVDRNVLISVDKKVMDVTPLNADRRSTVTYEIAVTNTGTAAGDYDLADVLRFGGDIKVESASADAQDDAPAANPNFDGVTDTTIVREQTIGGGDTHVFTVTVNARVQTKRTWSQADCAALGNDRGAGFLNEAVLTVDETFTSDQACATPPPPPVTPTSKKLPVTGGSSPLPLAVVAGLMVVLGIVIGRRKRSRRTLGIEIES